MASLLELLVSQKIISAEQAREAAGLAEETGAFIGRILVSQGAVEENVLADFLASECVELPPEEDLTPDIRLVQLLPERLMRNYRMVPLSQSPAGILRLAVSQPLSIGGIDQVKRRLGLPIRLVLVGADAMDLLVQRGFSHTALSSQKPAPTGQDQTPSDVSPTAFDAETSVATPEASARPEEVVEWKASGPAFVRPRIVEHRGDPPDGWRPDPVTHELGPPLEAAYEALRRMVEDGGHVYAALVGPDAARDLVLRKLYCAMWGNGEAAYADLVAHRLSELQASTPADAVILDGLEAASGDEDEERQLLREISGAYSARKPLVVGIRTTPKQAQTLSRGLRLTLGLAKTVVVDMSLALSEETPAPDVNAIFQSLAEETAAWSEEAFAGASLRPLIQAAARTYQRGNREEAVGKAAAAVASRLAHLTAESGS